MIDRKGDADTGPRSYRHTVAKKTRCTAKHHVSSLVSLTVSTYNDDDGTPRYLSIMPIESVWGGA